MPKLTERQMREIALTSARSAKADRDAERLRMLLEMTPERRRIFLNSPNLQERAEWERIARAIEDGNLPVPTAMDQVRRG